jgi:hypothetical protein
LAGSREIAQQPKPASMTPKLLTPKLPTPQRYPVHCKHYDRRQDNRVAARGIEKELRHSKVWMSAGDVFLRMSRADAKAVMKKDDETVADEIENVSIPCPL